jgi:hypothetical protein
MEYYPPGRAYNEKAEKIGQAVFFCDINEQRTPLSLIKEFSFIGDDTLSFHQSYFPVMESDWPVFAGELFFYNKEFPWVLNYKGVVKIASRHPFTLHFTVQSIQFRELEGAYQPSLNDMLAEFFTNTGMFLKKVLSTGL